MTVGDRRGAVTFRLSLPLGGEQERIRGTGANQGNGTDSGKRDPL